MSGGMGVWVWRGWLFGLFHFGYVNMFGLQSSWNM